MQYAIVLKYVWDLLQMKTVLTGQYAVPLTLRSVGQAAHFLPRRAQRCVEVVGDPAQSSSWLWALYTHTRNHELGVHGRRAPERRVGIAHDLHAW
jgi:hypothetical protein